MKGTADEPDAFTITSDQAYVAAATSACWKCNSKIEVICVYCETGTVSGEELTQFTVSNLWAMDEAMARQLAAWPDFRQVQDPQAEQTVFANHCRHCGALQDDLYLHSEPDQPFFSIPQAPPGSIRLTPIVGEVQLSGDESFEA